MRLKILIVPFFLILMLIISIGYIKPDFDEILTKKSEIVTQAVLLANMDSTLVNIQTLNSSLDREKESEDFLLHYLPYTLDQDQAIDAFNYLATQSGLIITEVSVRVSADRKSPKVDSDGSTLETPSVPEAKTFVFTGNVFGSYENIKVFFDRLTHMGRFQTVHLFGLEKPLENKESTSDLRGTFEAEYGYLPKKSGVSALNTPVFLKSELDFSDMVALRASITGIPSLEKGSSGKPNPFQ